MKSILVDINWQFPIVVIFKIFYFKTIFFSHFKNTFMIQSHTRIHMLNATGPLVTTAKPKAYEEFRAATCYFIRF